MIEVSEQKYRFWQNKLATSSTFRLWWQFWSNYAFIFFVVIFLYYFFLSFEPFIIVILNSIIAFCFSRLVVTVVINYWYKKQRPYQKYKFSLLTSKFFSWRTDEFNSFPSRHAITFSSIAIVVMMFSFPAGLVLFIATALTGMGRVILGYHWPVDIIAGLVLGSMAGYLVSVLMIPSIFT